MYQLLGYVLAFLCMSYSSMYGDTISEVKATSFHLLSTVPSYICGGRYEIYRDNKGKFGAQLVHEKKTIWWHYLENWAKGENWSVTFNAAPGKILAPGIYKNAKRHLFNGPRIDFSGNGKGCNTTRGDFEIFELTYDAKGAIVSFAANFNQRCDTYHSPSIFGAIRHNSSIPVRAAVHELFDKRSIPESVFYFKNTIVKGTDNTYTGLHLTSSYFDDEDEDEDDEDEGYSSFDDEDDEDNYNKVCDDCGYGILKLDNSYQLVSSQPEKHQFQTSLDSAFNYELIKDDLDGIIIKIDASEPLDMDDSISYLRSKDSWILEFNTKNDSGFEVGLIEKSDVWAVNYKEGFTYEPCLSIKKIDGSRWGEDFSKGEYKILDIERDSYGHIVRLALNFKARSYDKVKGIDGAIRFNSNYPIDLNNPFD